LASGQALFAAMYPGQAATVPWNTMDVGGDSETMFPNPNVCPNLSAARDRAMARFKNSSHYTGVTVPLAQKLSIALNRTVTTKDIKSYLDSLMSVQCATVPSSGGDPPAAFTTELQQQAIDEVVYQLYLACNDTDIAKFGAGPLLGEILAFMEDATKSAYAPKFVQWSGHDTGPMAPVLGALQIGGAEFPVFNDIIVMELYEIEMEKEKEKHENENEQRDPNVSGSRYTVRVVHNGQVVSALVPGCPSGEDLCPWESYHASVASLVPTPSECGRADHPSWWPMPAKSLSPTRRNN
jgi:hypothetical protein